MPVMYLADETTGECRGIREGSTPPAGTIDTGVAFTHGKQIWNTPTPGVWNEPPATWDDVSEKQKELIEGIRPRVERYITQRDNASITPKESASKYDEMTQYLQDVRDNDETNHPGDPDAAMAALEALVVPVEV